MALRPLPLAAPERCPAAEIDAPGWHPLIYAKRVRHVDRHARPGDVVAVYRDGELLGHALFNPRAEIRLRMIRTGGLPPDEAHWRDVLHRAADLRTGTLRLDGIATAYRVVHAEADGVSGLMVDRFGPVLAAEVFALGMRQRADAILAVLAERLGTEHTIVKCGPATLAQEGFEAPPAMSPGAPEQVLVHEHGTKYRIRFDGGHKTGFFCDQRDQRQRLAELCGGRSVLDLCCYTGGFAVAAKARGQAGETTAVDLDAAPLEIARGNADLNNARVRFAQADAFSYLRDAAAAGRQWEVVVLDPPKLIRSRLEYDEGVRKHRDLNKLAMLAVAPGGLLLTCSCAGLLPEEEFLRLVFAAARGAGREVRLLELRGAAACHPVSPRCPETRYLKAAWLRLD